MIALADELTIFSNFITTVWAKPYFWIVSLSSVCSDPEYTKNPKQ
jgi:hypothetical protein